MHSYVVTSPKFTKAKGWSRRIKKTLRINNNSKSGIDSFCEFCNFLPHKPSPPIDRIALIDTSFSVHLPVHQWQSFFIRESQLPKGIDSSGVGRPLVTCLWMECPVSFSLFVQLKWRRISHHHIRCGPRQSSRVGIRWSGELSE